MDKSKEEKSRESFFLEPRTKNPRVFQMDDFHLQSKGDNYHATEQDIREKLAEANKNFKDLTAKIDKMEADAQEKLDKELGKVKRQIEESKTKVVETLALFAALFTFLSLQVNILTEETNIENIIGLILISGGMITFFVLILDIMVKTHDEANSKIMKWRFNSLLAVTVLLIINGILIMILKV